MEKIRKNINSWRKKLQLLKISVCFKNQSRINTIITICACLELPPTISGPFQGRDYSSVWFGGYCLFFFPYFYKKENTISFKSRSSSWKWDVALPAVCKSHSPFTPQLQRQGVLPTDVLLCIILKHSHQVLHTPHWNNAHLRSHYWMWPKRKQMLAIMG